MFQSNTLLDYVFQSNTLLDVNWENGQVRRLDLSGFLEAAAKSVTTHFRQQQVSKQVAKHLSYCSR